VPSPSTFANPRPSAASELGPVVSEDNSREAPTEENLLFQGGGDGFHCHAGYRESLNPSGEHIRGDQDEALTRRRTRVRALQIDCHAVPWCLGLPRTWWPCANRLSSLGGSAIAASTHVPEVARRSGQYNHSWMDPAVSALPGWSTRASSW
jgi:hypothetical protein